MNWQQVCEDSSLQDLPYKIELNEYGQVVLSPASNQHGHQRARLAILLTQHGPEGEVISECSIDTPKGVKVADVVWASPTFIKQHGYATPYSMAPEICVEISSPSDSDAELGAKMNLYFEKGAKEVWICNDFGALSFHQPQGSIPTSNLIRGFPSSI